MELFRELDPSQWASKKEAIEQLNIAESEIFKLIENRFLRVAIHNGQLLVSRQSIREYNKERELKSDINNPVQKLIPVELPTKPPKPTIPFHEKIFIKCTEYSPGEFGYKISDTAIAFRKPVSTILAFVEKNHVEVVHIGDVHYLKRQSFRNALEKAKIIIPEGNPSSFFTRLFKIDFLQTYYIILSGKEMALSQEKNMADTQRGGLSGILCSDCGEAEAVFRHWGDLVPEGKVGCFCFFCWNERMAVVNRGDSPKPLGVKPPGEPKELADKAIKVTTQSGSIYELSAPSTEGERKIFCSTRNLGFDNCRILSLILGKDLWLRSSDGENLLWATTRVVLIE